MTLPLYEGFLDSEFARYNYGNALVQLSRYPEAAEQFEIATQMRPDFASAYNNWGNTLVLMGDREDGLERIRKALEYEPNHPDALASLAKLVGPATVEDSR